MLLLDSGHDPGDFPVTRSGGKPVRNVHQRHISASREEVGGLLDSLSGTHDRLWPFENWPPMRLRGPLGVGAQGGHGPIRYRVEDYEPGVRVSFRFTSPRGFLGTHAFQVNGEDGSTVLRHIIDMRTTGAARLSWPLVFGPLHDALMEDCLDKAEAVLRGEVVPRPRWPSRVRVLRAVGRWLQRRGMKRRRAPSRV